MAFQRGLWEQDNFAQVCCVDKNVICRYLVTLSGATVQNKQVLNAGLDGGHCPGVRLTGNMLQKWKRGSKLCNVTSTKPAEGKGLLSVVESYRF
jgi:hypothetical protein